MLDSVRRSSSRWRALWRVALSHYVTSGLSAAVGLLAISTVIHALGGAFASSVAGIGVLVCIPPDMPAPRRGKFWALLPAAMLGLPLFVAVQALAAHPWGLGALLVPASFAAFLGGAWGKRGLPLAVSAMFAMIFSMAVPAAAGEASLLWRGGFFALGAALYLLWAVLMNRLLNGRYRRLILADTLATLAALVRTQAGQFGAVAQGQPLLPLGPQLRQQSALTDQLQAARDLLFETPDTPERQRWAAMLLQALEMRDHLVACALDVDALTQHPQRAALAGSLQQVLVGQAEALQALVDDLVLNRRPHEAPVLQPLLSPWLLDQPAVALDDGTMGSDARGLDERDVTGPQQLPPAALAHSLASRVGHIHEEGRRLTALARGDALPSFDALQQAWQLFVSPADWSWAPLMAVMRWQAPTLRHALRAALAIGAGYALAVALPWGTHDYWILLTIVVVLRGSLAQTLERRNHRVMGTVIGCLLTTALLAAHLPHAGLLLVMTVAQAVAHGFALRRYLVTAVGATVLGLLQAHLLRVGASPLFDEVERIADTLIGAGLAWLFSYVLPSWERGAMSALVQRAVSAQVRHAQLALALGQPGDGVGSGAHRTHELAWRLARREAYDSLSALVQATQRALAEPRAVQPPLAPLERLLARSYLMLGQLTAVKTLLLLRREQLDLPRLQPDLTACAASIEQHLAGGGAADATADRVSVPWQPAGPDDRGPWLLRRLALSRMLASQLRADVDEVRRGLPSASSFR